MKKLLVGILALLFSFAVFAGTTDLDRLLLHERYGEDPWLGFGTMAGTSGVFTLEFDDADSDAVCLVLDLPAGGTTNVPVFLMTSTSSIDYGYFANVTVPTFALEDDDGDSYVKLDWSDDDDARLAVGGSGAELSFVAPTLGLTATTALNLFSPSISLGYDIGATLVLAVTDATGVAAMTQTGSGSTMTWTVPTYTFVNSTAFDAFSPSIDLGFDTGAKLTIAVADATGVTAITHSGSGPTMAWTVPIFIFTNSTSMSMFTPSWVMGFDVGAAMTVAISDTSGITAITHAGNAVTVAWTAPSFDFIGDINLDNTDIDGTFALDGTTAALTCSTSIINYTPLFRIGYDAAAYMLITTTQTSGAVAITHPSGTGPDVTWTADSLSFVGDFSSNGATASLDGSTTVDLISAGRVDIEAPVVRLGFDSNYYMTFTTTQTSSNLAITHTGTPAVTWAATSFDFSGTMTLDGTTIGGNLSQTGVTTLLDGSTSVRAVSAGFVSLEANDIRFGFDASSYMKIVPVQTTGSVAITHVGSGATAVSWTADTFDFVGTMAQDLTTFGANAAGVDVTFYGAVTQYKTWWDADADSNGTWYFGADDYGIDVTFYGRTQTESVTWDASADTWFFGASNDEGVDVKFYGGGAGNYVIWDENIDTFVFVDGNIKLDDDAEIYIGTKTGVTTADGDFKITWVSDTRMDITATVANSQVCIGDGSVATDFLIDNIIAGSDFFFDASGDGNKGILHFGADDLGFDVVFYGATQTESVTWDASADTWYFGASDDEGVDITTYGETAGAALDWDASDDALELDGTANITHEDAVGAGVLFLTIATGPTYSQTASATVLKHGGIDIEIPANADIEKIEIVVTTAYNGGGNDTMDVGKVTGAGAYYANDVDVSSAGYLDGNVFTNIGDVGGTAIKLNAQYTDANSDASAGACLIYIYWRNY